MSEAEILSNQKTILKHQEELLANQKTILDNQGAIKANHDILQEILKNQELILESLRK